MRYLHSLTVAAALALGGCATTGGIDPGTATQIQNATMAACSFLPSVNMIAALIGKGAIVGPIINSPIVKAICDAADAGGAAVVPKGATVNGVPVDGRFIR
jgi:hypothetical protein